MIEFRPASHFTHRRTSLHIKSSIEVVLAGITIESWLQFVDVEKSGYYPLKKPDDSAHSDTAKSLIGLGGRTGRCPTLRFLTLASAGVNAVSFLRNLVVYRCEPISPSVYRRGRIAPVVHHRRPHNIP